ncbi:MAG: hypothetical protein QM755_17740 [Luteolibacter sp.]
MTLLGDIFTYALRGSGKYILITGAVLSVIADLVSLAPLIGILAGLVLFGYFCALYFEVIQTTATGGAEAPMYPNTSKLMEDIIWPALQTFITGLISFLPVIAYSWFGPKEPSASLMLGLAGFGMIYFPMAMLAVVVLGRLSAAGPHIVIPAMFRAGWLYALAVFLLFFLYMAQSMVGSFLEGMPIIRALVLAVVSMYVLLTNGRMLGVIYRERQEELNWL